MIDVGMQASPVSATEPPTSSAVSVSEGPMLGLASGVPLPTSRGPLVIPWGPVVAATPQPLVNPDVSQAMHTAGAQPISSLVSSKPLGDPVSHLPTGLAAYPAYAQQCLALPPVPSSVLPAPTASLFKNQRRLVLRLHCRLVLLRRCLRLLLGQILGRLMLA